MAAYLMILLAPLLGGDRDAMFTARAIALAGADGPGGHGHKQVIVVTTDDDGDEDADSAPGVWLGIRMAPMPAPLRAHLKQDGLMIDNVVRDSPADRAGLERFDVVVSFDGRKITSSDELIDALRACEPGEAVNMQLIHQGESKTISITPAERPDDMVPEYKYDELFMGEDDALNYFGHMLRVGPRGKVMINPLGRMRGLTKDLVKQYMHDMPGVHFWTDDDGMEIDIDELLKDLSKRGAANGAFSFSFGDDEDADESTEIIIRVEKDDETIEITRHDDGSYELTRQRDGKRTHETFKNADEFRDKEPELYERYGSAVDAYGNFMVFTTPDIARLRDMQREVEETLQQRLSDVDKRAQEAIERLRRSREIARRARRGHADDDEEAAAPSRAQPERSITFSVMIDNGHYTVDVKSDGAHEHYEFDSEETFRKSKPGLYAVWKESRRQAPNPPPTP